MNPILRFFGIKEANAAYQSAEAVIDPLLVAAGVTELKIKGEVIPIEKAMVADKISAYAALAKPGAEQQKVADLVVTNDTLAKSARESMDKLTVAESTVQALQRDLAERDQQLATANAAMHSLTDRLAQSGVVEKAATDTIARHSAEIAAFNTELSKRCISHNCLDLRDANDKPLATDATTEQKLAIAEKIPWRDKLKADDGALNVAMSKLGINVATIPGAPITGTTPAKKELKGRDRFLAADRSK